MEHYKYMAHFSKKIFLTSFFIFTLFSLFGQSNNPFAKNINLSLEKDKLILNWENPEIYQSNSQIEKILIYNDSKEILSKNQLTKENLVATLDKNASQYIISDKKYFSPYFAVIYKFQDNSLFDILIITENTTIYNKDLDEKIAKLKNYSEVKQKEPEKLVGLEEGKLRSTPLPTMSLDENKGNSQKSSKEKKLEIDVYVFDEDKSEKAMGISYELNQIISKYFPESQFNEAISEFSALLQNKHDLETTSRIYFYLGECYYFSENHIEALNCFLQSEKSYPAISKKWQQYVLNSFNY